MALSRRRVLQVNRARLAARLATVDVARDEHRRQLAVFLGTEPGKRDLERMHSSRAAYFAALESLAELVRNELSGGT